MALYQTIKRPIITEKSMQDAASGKYTFEVDKQANKKDIKTAIAKQFGVTPIRVFTRLVKGKTYKSGSRRQKTARKTPWKKTIVQVKTGEKIGLFELST
ncbi:50S ribosomal protein L23 [Candidatus Daviesbacteria bacterium]|nr:50S ribosomal protein L23 [Candidatus Daviesbacteria bacterium]